MLLYFQQDQGQWTLIRRKKTEEARCTAARAEVCARWTASITQHSQEQHQKQQYCKAFPLLLHQTLTNAQTARQGPANTGMDAKIIKNGEPPHRVPRASRPRPSAAVLHVKNCCAVQLCSHIHQTSYCGQELQALCCCYGVLRARNAAPATLSPLTTRAMRLKPLRQPGR